MNHKDILFRLRDRALPAIPHLVGRLPYSGALGLGQLLARTSSRGARARLWARNSFVLGSFVPFLSDLDLTCWFDETPTPRALRRVQRRLRLLKRVFPFLGETGFYFAPSSPTWIALMNPVEFDRDPKLRARLGLPEREATGPEATAALLRYLETDWHNLRRNPWIRAPKWAYHLSRLDLQLPPAMRLSRKERRLKPVPIEDVLRALTKAVLHPLRLGDSAEASAAETVMSVLEKKARGIALHTLPLGEVELAFFPHRFCFHERFETIHDPGKAQVLVHQLAWELWGLSCQLPSLAADDHLTRHLHSLQRLHASIEETHPKLALLTEVRGGLHLLLGLLLGRTAQPSEA